jgi:DNA-directed RNA polymerase sigma subunit (sigma70/sigma32)
VGTLDECERRVIQRLFLDHPPWTYKTIAEDLSCCGTPRTIKKIETQALKKLAKLVSPAK